MKYDIIALWCCGILGGCFGQILWSNYLPHDQDMVQMWIGMAAIVFVTGRKFLDVRDSINSVSENINKVIDELDSVNQKP